MRATIAKWGNSLALRLPRQVVEKANMKEGAIVDIAVRAGVLVIKPMRQRYELSDLLTNHESKHRHMAVRWGTRRGEEVW